MRVRDKLVGTDTVQDMVVKMCEGNPGALGVLLEIVNHPDGGPLIMLRLADMNIRGAQLWVAYKDYCRRNLGMLLMRLEARDPRMVEVVNREIPDETAVVIGWRG